MRRGKQRREGGGGIVRRRTVAGDADGHEDRTRQHRRGLPGALLARPPLRGLVEAVEQGVESDLRGDVATVTALIVEMRRIPFAEDVIGPAIDGMAVVVSAHVERQFVEQFQVELGLRRAGSPSVVDRISSAWATRSR